MFILGGEAEGLGGSKGRVHFLEGLRGFLEGVVFEVAREDFFLEGLLVFLEGVVLEVAGEDFFLEVVVLVMAAPLLCLVFRLALSMTALATSSVTSTRPCIMGVSLALSRDTVSDGVELGTKPEALERISSSSALICQVIVTGTFMRVRYASRVLLEMLKR